MASKNNMDSYGVVQIPNTRTRLQPVLESTFGQARSWSTFICDALDEDESHSKPLFGDQFTHEQFRPVFQDWCSHDSWHSLCPHELIWAIVESGDAPSSDAPIGEKGDETLLGMVMMQPCCFSSPCPEGTRGWNCSFFVKKAATRKGHATNAVTAALKWMKQTACWTDGPFTVPRVVLMGHEASNLGSGGVVQHVLEECGGKWVADTVEDGEAFCNYVLDLSEDLSEGAAYFNATFVADLANCLEEELGNVRAAVSKLESQRTGGAAAGGAADGAGAVLTPARKADGVSAPAPSPSLGKENRTGSQQDQPLSFACLERQFAILVQQNQPLVASVVEEQNAPTLSTDLSTEQMRALRRWSSTQGRGLLQRSASDEAGTTVDAIPLVPVDAQPAPNTAPNTQPSTYAYYHHTTAPMAPASANNYHAGTIDTGGAIVYPPGMHTHGHMQQQQIHDYMHCWAAPSILGAQVSQSTSFNGYPSGCDYNGASVRHRLQLTHGIGIENQENHAVLSDHCAAMVQGLCPV
jgi:hypothetical protein